MRIASIKPNDLAVVRNDQLVLIGEALAQQGALPRAASMIDLIRAVDHDQRRDRGSAQTHDAPLGQ